MRYPLLPDVPAFKANLHCHTTCSDGRLTPEEIRDIYMKEGYSIVAYTDHDVLIPHPELYIEGKFLPLNGYEMEINKEADAWATTKTCHMCLIATRPGLTRMVCYHRSRYLFGNAVNLRDRLDFDPDEPDYERSYTPACISDMMRRGREAGYFVTYNHPQWSLEDYADYTAYRNMHALELMNYGCIVEGYSDDNGLVYQQMLAAGIRLGCVASDDNHNSRQPGDPGWDSFGTFTVIHAPALTVTDVGNALLEGHYYASSGPYIRQLYLEDGTVYVQCDPAQEVRFMTSARANAACRAAGGEDVTCCSFRVPDGIDWFRIQVMDRTGAHADTCAYFPDELPAEALAKKA